MADLPSAVLFACTSNAIRSPMAEGIFRHLFGHRVFVDSVGIREGRLDLFAVAVMEEIGIDITRHRPKTFDDLEDESFDEIVSLSPEAHHRAVEVTRVMACETIYWNVLDPSAGEGSRAMRLHAFRDVRDYLMRRIQQRYGSLPMAQL